MKRIWASCRVVLGVVFGLQSAAPQRAWAAEPEPPPPAFEAALREADHRFVNGDLLGALELLEPACSGSDRPECAFNLGAIHHGLGHCPLALGFYRRYLELAPNGERVVEVRDALEEVEARCGAAANIALGGSLPGARTGAVLAGVAPILQPPEAAAPASALSISGEPSGASEQGSLSADLAVGSFALAGVAALSSVAFGLLAAHDANQCARARSYDREFIERCENSGPRYQGLWQGFALASGSFLGIGVALWAFDSAAAPSGIAGSPAPLLRYRGQF